MLMRRALLLHTASSIAMSTSSRGPTSRRLAKLISHLRLYTPSSPPADDDDVDDRGKVFSRMGLAESSAPKPIPNFNPQKAAVLICLFEADDAAGDLRVLLTKRSSALSSHPGEVSLPGGKAEEGDKDDVETALREAKEEIGLEPSHVTIVKILEPFISKHLLRVVPVIGILTDKRAFKPTANSGEVEAIFDAPLEMFLKDDNRRSEEVEWMGQKCILHFFNYETEGKQYVIWGSTASILIRAASIVYQKPPCFPEHYPKFRVN